MLTIGLTGTYASGKSTVCRMFADLGVATFSADSAAHEVMAEQSTIDAIVDCFGKSIICEDNAISREKLANLVFSDANKRKQLEEIVHPRVRKHLFSQVNAATNSPYCIIEVPLLFETDFHTLVDKTLVVTANEERILERGKQRDDRSTAQIKQIIAAQLSPEAKQNKADDVIVNNGSLEKLSQEVRNLHNRYETITMTGLPSK